MISRKARRQADFDDPLSWRGPRHIFVAWQWGRRGSLYVRANTARMKFLEWVAIIYKECVL